MASWDNAIGAKKSTNGCENPRGCSRFAKFHERDDVTLIVPILAPWLNQIVNAFDSSNPEEISSSRTGGHDSE